MINSCNFFDDSPNRVDSQISQHNIRGAGALPLSTLDSRITASQLAEKVLEDEPISELELDNDFFKSKFLIPKEMSENLVQTLKQLSLLANNMIKERKTPLALETSLSQPIVLSKDEHAFLKLFKKLLDKSLEAREYQDKYHPVDKTDTRVNSSKYVDGRLLDILEKEANIQASFLNIVKKLISFNHDVVIGKLDRRSSKLDFYDIGDTLEERGGNLYNVFGEMKNEDLIDKAFQLAISILETDDEKFTDKALQIEIPQIGHFIMNKSPVMFDEPSMIFISYFKEKPDLDLYVIGQLKPDLQMEVAPIYSDDSPNNPRRAKAFNAYGNALKLFEEVFKGEPRNIISA
jgi:hypothetical protein